MTEKPKSKKYLYNLEWRKRNRERVKMYNTAFYLRNREEILAKIKAKKVMPNE